MGAQLVTVAMGSQGNRVPAFHTGASTALALNLTSEVLAFRLREQAGILAKTAPEAAPILISLFLVQ